MKSISRPIICCCVLPVGDSANWGLLARHIVASKQPVTLNTSLLLKRRVSLIQWALHWEDRFKSKPGRCTDIELYDTEDGAVGPLKM